MTEPEGDEVLSPIVARAAESMRAEVPVRAEWRAALLDAVGAAEAPRRLRVVPGAAAVTAAPPARRAWWEMGPIQSVAAGLALFALGAASAGLVLHGRTGTGAPPASDVAAAPSASQPGSQPGSQPAASAEGAPAAVTAVTAVTAVATPVAGAPGAAGPHVRFMLVAPVAARVSIVGDFNRWDPRATPMRRLEDGRTWIVDVPLAAGRHVYSFVVDGGLTVDPAAPRAAEDDFGVPSSVVMVPGRAS